MTAEIVEIRQIVRLECSGCGAAAEGSCSCGVAYVPVKARVAQALAENPGKSDRAIAADIGTNPMMVGRVRKANRNDVTVDDERVGLDGKTRRLPRRELELKVIIEDADQELAEVAAAEAYRSIIARLTAVDLKRLMRLARRFTLIIGPDKKKGGRPMYAAIAGDAAEMPQHDLSQEDPANFVTAYLLRADQAAQFATYSGPVTPEIVAMARQAATAWLQLADRLEGEHLQSRRT